MTMLRGVVHDPTARRMGGVAGHAGLFSTAADLALFCRMLLGGGAVGATRILSPLAVARMTSPATPAGEANVRGLGWDIDSSFSANRGELLPLGSFGHTGFTGTSIWIDPATRVFVIFLSNRVHPDGPGDVTPLRARVATIVGLVADRRRCRTLATTRRSTGKCFDVADSCRAGAARATRPDGHRRRSRGRLQGARRHSASGSSPITPAAPATARRRSICSRNAPGVKLVALFSPEHGIRGILDAAVPVVERRADRPADSLALRRDPASDGRDARPGLDAIVIDLQDIGTRFYTYMTTMAYVMEEAAARKIKVVVLDRPNPIGGVQIEGPALDEAAVGFIGYLPAMPIRHGLTMGELARLFNAEKKIGADLTVVAMKNWRRDAWFDETGLPWIEPVAEHAQPPSGDALPGHRRVRVHEPLGRPRHRHAVRARRRAVDRRRAAGRGAERPPDSRRALLPRALHAHVEQVRRRGVPGRVHGHHRSRCAAARARRRRDRLGAGEAVSRQARGRRGAPPVRIGGRAGDRIKAGDDPAAIAASWSGAEARWRLLRAKYLLY